MRVGVWLSVGVSGGMSEGGDWLFAGKSGGVSEGGGGGGLAVCGRD